MADLVVTEMRKTFGASTAVAGISFHVADGEFVTLLGPSGCGKSTTLAAIAGLEHPDSGRISAGKVTFFDGSARIALPAELRNCGLVFQAYALWPHMTARQNVAFPLRLRKVGRAELDRRVEEVLALVEMTNLADRYPHQLSGGQQQRVALARTLVYEPALLLLDEPLSNLDAKLRERARAWLAELHRKIRRTTIYVTHDQVEALALSDRIIVMHEGRIVQIGTPEEIYNAPTDPFVADFIGTSSFLEGRLLEVHADGGATIELGGGQRLRAGLCRGREPGSPVVVAIRPERVTVSSGPTAPDEGDGSRVTAEIRARSFIGPRYQYEIATCGGVIRTESVDRIDSESVSLWIPSAACIAFPAGADRRASGRAATEH